jgi:PEP-CTERM motif
VAFYNSLPIAPDADSIPNDKDDFLKSLLNGQLTTTPTPGNAYSAVGLEDSGIPFELISGDWVMTHVFGWTEFEIDPDTQDLLVTTWGISWTDVVAALGDDAALAALLPQIVGQFRVSADVREPATLALFGLGAVAAFIGRRRRAI